MATYIIVKRRFEDCNADESGGEAKTNRNSFRPWNASAAVTAIHVHMSDTNVPFDLLLPTSACDASQRQRVEILVITTYSFPRLSLLSKDRRLHGGELRNACSPDHGSV
jgi:hypothetical protein